MRHLTITLHCFTILLFACPSSYAQDWQQRTPTTSPSQRNLLVLAYDESHQTTVLYGGYNVTANDDTWTWDGNNWIQVATSGPGARYWTQMVYDAARQELVLFGGVLQSNGQTANDTWVWNGTQWHQRFPANSPSVYAPAVILAYDSARALVLLFDGLNGVTWTWDGTNWTERYPSTIPSVVVEGAMAYDPISQQVILFGGQTNNNESSNDTWVWDGTNWQTTTLSVKPAGRTGHRMVSTPYGVLLFGGQNSSTWLNDTWIWQGQTWVQQTTTTIPAARVNHGFSYDTRRKQAVLFGGQEAPSYYFGNDTWVFPGQTNALLSASPSALTFSYQQGATGIIPSKNVLVTSGSSSVSFGADTSTNPPGGNWLSMISTSNETPGAISVGISSSLTKGTYTGSLKLTSSEASNSPLIIPVTLDVASPAVTTGTISVQSTPPGAFFQLSGPGLTYVATNTPFQQSGFAAGTYKLTWSIFLGGYQTPAQQTQQLPPGSSILFSGIYGVPTESSFKLSFPLQGHDPYDVRLNTVFDHSMSTSSGKYTLYAANGYDGNVTDFANEQGLAKYSTTPLPDCAVNDADCSYPQRGFVPFFVNTQYGGVPATTLNYENHPGTDYHVDQGTQTQVLAAVSGRVVYPSTMIGLSSPSPFHVLAIVPDMTVLGAYVVYYLHLDTYRDSPVEAVANPPAGCPTTLPIPEGTAVSAGCVIGRAGGWGIVNGQAASTAYNVHLHLEVHKVISFSQIPAKTVYSTSRFQCPREVDPTGTLACLPVDPYGWDGPPGTDPYTIITADQSGNGIRNIRLWDYSPTISSLSPANVTSGVSTIAISGNGFPPGSTVVVMGVVVDPKTQSKILVPCVQVPSVTAVNSSTTCAVTSSITSTSSATVTGKWTASSAPYYIYLVTPNGQHSNWQLVSGSVPTGGNR